MGADSTPVEDSLDQLIAPVVGNVVPKLVLRDVDIVGPLGVLPHARDVLLDIADTTDGFLGILHVVAKLDALQLLLVGEVVVLHTLIIFKFEFLITNMAMLCTHDGDKIITNLSKTHLTLVSTNPELVNHQDLSCHPPGVED